MGKEKMWNRVVLIRYVLMLWLLCGTCDTVSVASASMQTPQYASWGYQQLPSMGTACNQHTTVYTGATPPSYQFKTTSAYVFTSGKCYQPVGIRENRMLRSIFDEPGEDDDPTGVVPDPVPLGEVPWLIMLLLAAGYLTICSRKRHPIKC